MVVAIFVNRRSTEEKTISREIAEIQADLSRRGLLNSGANIKATMRAYESGVIRAVEGTLEELALQFRQAGRRDATLFWNLIEPKLLDLGQTFSKSSMETALSSLRDSDKWLAKPIGQQAFTTLSHLIATRVHELRIKSQFIVLKTPEDRRANGVPDVAVMMWFPDSRTDKFEDVEAAKLRYEAIRQAVAEASGGLATVNKFDDPTVVPQERISASIETWLEKAVVVICDLGGQRHNVYYEFGYARAISTDVLLTCPAAESGSTKLHLGHWQRIEYGDLSELKNILVEKLKVLLSKYDLSGSL